MSTPVAAVILLAALTAAVDWVAVARSATRLERVAKPAMMIVLLTAVPLAGLAPWPARPLLLAALTASLAGDWFLLPPARFTAGLAAFLAAHLAYLAIFLLGDLQAGPALAGIAATAALLATGGRSIVAGARRVGLGTPVAAYMGAICLMAIAATSSGSALATGGAWLFVASDTILGWDRFAAAPATSAAAAAARRLAVIVTYHAAQVLLTVAVLGSPAS